MICPACQYMMDDFDKECPRCHGKGLAPPAPNAPSQTNPIPTQPAPPPPYPGPSPYPTSPIPGTMPGDAPSFWMAFLGFVIPLVGLILFLVERDSKPLRARSAGRGAALGFGLSLIAVPLFLMTAVLLPVGVRARENALRASCQSNLKQLSLAAFQYSQEHGEKYPDFSSPDSIRAQLSPYVSNPEIFECPKDHQPYRGNTEISNKGMAEIENPAVTIMFSESEHIHLEGSSDAYADGHVKWNRD